MRFSIVSILAFVAAAVAQSGPNAFDLPTGTLVLTAGQAKTLTWSNKAGNTVTLLLREGANSDLKTVSTIASNIANTGSYTWTPPADTPEGADYAIEIINDDDTSEVNYTEQFVIQSNVKAVASGSSTGVVTATGSMATGSASASASASASGSMTGSASGSMTTMTGSASASGSATASGSSKGASSTSAGSGTVPTNAAAKPAVGAVGGLLAVAAGFAIAM